MSFEFDLLVLRYVFEMNWIRLNNRGFRHFIPIIVLPKVNPITNPRVISV